MNLAAPPLDDSPASHDARVRWILRAFPGAVVVSGAPALLPVPRPVRRRPARPLYAPYPAYPVGGRPAPSPPWAKR